jgi:hypothetical protein
MADKPGIGTLKGAAGEAKAREKAHTEKRGRAHNILLPGEIHGGQWDAQKVIETTLGGSEWSQKRVMTPEDLEAIKRNIDTLRERYTGGITPRQIIDLSYPSRVTRARKEIFQAVPWKQDTTKRGTAVFKFVTNAGPDCRHSPKRHHVTVELLSFPAAVAAAKKTPTQMATWLRKQPLLFDCDCEDHTYRFRYIATVGRFNYGRSETGYPKIRNPHLTGIACKHTIRVAQEIASGGAFLGKATALIEKARKDHMGQARAQMSQKEADELAKRQAQKPARIRTAAERAEQTRKAREAAAAKRAAAKIAAVKPIKVQVKRARVKESDLTKRDARVVAQMRAVGMPEKAIQQFIKKSVEAYAAKKDKGVK